VLRVAVLGAGAWGIHHVRVIAADPRCRLVTVADPDDAVAAHVHKLAAVPVVRDAAIVLADPAVDAVVVASPSCTHASLAAACLAAGKHVLVEKPLAMDTPTAVALAGAARAAGRVAMVGHLMLFHPAVVRLRDLVQSGALGALRYLTSTRAGLGRIRSDESALWSFGPHDLSMIDFLLGRSPTSITARGQCVLHDGVEDVVFVSLRYAGGELAHVQLSRVSPRKERRLVAVGTDKLAELDDVAADKLRIYGRGWELPPAFTEYAEFLALRGGDVHIPQIVMVEPLHLQLQHFVDCVQTGATPRTDFDSAARITAVLAAAQRSLERDGAPVDLEELR
jgi:predicted dehydrogenase